MHNLLFYIIVGILVFNFLIERIINYINSKHITTKLPEELQGIYDEEEYRKSQEYKKANDKFSFITSSFSFILIMGMLFLGGFQLVRWH